MSAKELYNKAYLEEGNPENDFLVQREKIIDIIIKYLEALAGERVLDIGCNYGFFQRQISERTGAIVYGVDINEEAIKANTNKHKYLMDATRRLEFPDGYFQKIYSSHTVEHIKDLGSVFQEMHRVLASKGRIVLIYPWELFRGMAAVCAGWRVYRNPLYGRKLHVHKLNPKMIERFAGVNFKPIKHELRFMRTPQWVSVFERSD